MGVVVFAVMVWWGHFWSMGWRVHYSLVALAALALTRQLVSWNLLVSRTFLMRKRADGRRDPARYKTQSLPGR